MPRSSVLAVPVVAILAALAVISQVSPVEASVSRRSAVVDAAPAGPLVPFGSTRTTGSSAVALTFDDGPDPVVTPDLLDLLKQQNVKATFCVTGFRARDNPAIIARIAAEGHTLCNHSWQHLENLAKLDEAAIKKDLAATSKAIQKAAPGVKVRYFRAPYGNFTPRLNQIALKLGMTGVSWNVDDQSWDSPTYGKGSKMVDHIIAVVKKNTRNGSIVLSHEMAKPWTVTAYRTLLPWLKARFTLIPLPPRMFPAPVPAGTQPPPA